MADARLGKHLGVVALCLAGASGCAGSAPPPVVLAAPARTPAVAFSDDPRPLPHYHSARLALDLPLPDGHAWRIDDHTRAELVATHEATHSRVMVASFRADTIVGRVQCEDLARERHLVTTGALRTLEDGPAITQNDYDTRVWVAVETGNGPSSPLVGHVMAFGGFLRKCYAFDFTTRVDSAADEDVLSARLAYARARILGGLRLTSPLDVPREAPVAPVPPPAPAP